MAATRTTLPTRTASRYITRLCAHWRHKFAVQGDDTQALIPFGIDNGNATCRLVAGDTGLAVTVDAPESDSIAGRASCSATSSDSRREARTCAWSGPAADVDNRVGLGEPTPPPRDAKVGPARRLSAGSRRPERSPRSGPAAHRLID